MGKLAEYLKKLIKEHIKDKGIVLWFDPEQHYRDVFDAIDIKKEQKFFFDGSYFELRYKLDFFLENTDLPELLIYVHEDKNKTDNALIEIEKAGCVLYPGHQLITQNTRLEVVAREALKDILPEVDTICQQIACGSLTFKDVEKIVKEHTGAASGAIKLVFDTIDPVEIIFNFMTVPDLDKDIISKKLMPELKSLFDSSIGYFLYEQASPEETRENIKYYIIMGDFLEIFSPDEIPHELLHLKRPEDELHRKNISHIINRWRNDIKNKDSYIKASMDTEQKFKIKNFNINPQKMVDIQTFISIEEKLIDWICEEFISGHSKNLYSIIEKKKHSFWACNNEKILMKWNILETSLMVCSISKSINNELKGNKFGTEELIKKYCYGENNWATLDGFHRELEQRFERFDVDLSVDYSLIEKAVVKARQIYMDNVGNMAEIFQSSCISSSFKIKDFLPQREIYSSTVKPLVNNGKTAYILVDALRYEMGVELVKGFGDDFEIEIKPAVSTLPSITNTGMTSLLPDAQKDFGIEETGGVNINGNIINSRKDRIKYLEEYLKDKKFLETKIENILKPSKKLRQEIKESDFILVTSQEIDAICEQGNITMARRIMSDILAQIRRSIRNLVELGIYNFVLTADHGYLFFEKIESANKIDVPEGNKIELHRRAWAGKGGNMSNSFILLSEKDIGLSGDCNLAFPKRIACFKVKGQDNPYFHGGISLQEMIIPLIIIKHKSVKIIDKIDSEIHLIIEKEKITTRFFTVQILWKSPGQLSFISDGEKYKRVRLLVRDNGNEVGTAVQAVYGFEDGTQDIILEKDKPDYVTVLIGEEIKCKTVNIYLLDGETFVELAKKEKIPVELSI